MCWIPVFGQTQCVCPFLRKRWRYYSLTSFWSSLILNCFVCTCTNPHTPQSWTRTVRSSIEPDSCYLSPLLKTRLEVDVIVKIVWTDYWPMNVVVPWLMLKVQNHSMAMTQSIDQFSDKIRNCSKYVGRCFLCLLYSRWKTMFRVWFIGNTIQVQVPCRERI
jgi:hypothetical protein